MSDLNPQQQEAVTHIHGPLLVLAGAGSGKTRVVTFRIAHLIDSQVSPKDILALTFTNKAADEMRKRIQSLKNALVLTSTFHSLGARILRESITSIGFNPNFTIYDQDDSEKILKMCLEEMGKAKTLLRKMKSVISSAKNDLLPPEEIQDREEREIYLAYEKKMKECNALDFDDLLYLTVKLLKTDPKALEEYQNRWLFILIDEYQDTNFAQYTIAKLLTTKHKNLFAVGDPDQSIYSWRGARYQNILNFASDFPGAKIIKLNQNYRSTDIILKASNALIQHNSERYDKELWSDLGPGNKIILKVCQKERDEAQFVASQIQRYYETRAYPLNDMVIFYRTNAQSRVFEDFLLTYRIPYEIIGGMSFYDRREVKDLLAFLKMAISDNDLVSFLRTINLPKRGLGQSFVDTLVQDAALSGLPIYTYIKERIPQQKKGLTAYIDIIERLRENQSKLQIHQLLQQTLNATKYLDFLKEDPETEQDRKENIDELIGKAAEWEEMQEKPTLMAFLEELSLNTQITNIKNVPTLKLMTLHNSKGLEFPIVFLVGMEEELLPHANSLDDPEKVEEERRLCYVGMTRAKRQLYLCRANIRSMWGATRFMYPSRFLREIPKQYIQEI